MALTLSDAVETYLAELALIGRSPKTVKLQTDLLRLLVKGLEDGVRIGKISRRDVTSYLAGMAERGLSQSYVGTNGKVIHRFFNWAVEQGILKGNPLEGMTITMGPDKPIAPFSDDECRRLIMAADTPFRRLVILLLLDTGMRASELCSLRLQDIDLVRGEIAIQGKGGRSRKVALNERPQRALEEYLASKAQQDGLLWPEGWNRTNLTWVVDSVAHRAHVCCCHPHRFRHNWSVRLRRAGVDAIALQQLLGHSSLKMTMRYIAYCEGEHAVEVHRQHSVLPM